MENTIEYSRDYTLRLQIEAAALAGLIQYRMRDRRWLIVTAMAVTILFVSMELFLLISSLDNKDAVLPAMRYIMRHVIAGTVGVIWTLCC